MPVYEVKSCVGATLGYALHSLCCTRKRQCWHLNSSNATACADFSISRFTLIIILSLAHTLRCSVIRICRVTTKSSGDKVRQNALFRCCGE